MCFEIAIIVEVVLYFVGNSAWLLKNGQSLGETQAGLTYEDTGMATINHPIDVQYESASAEGWPLFVCEVSLL